MDKLTPKQEERFQSLVDKSEKTKERVQRFLEDIDKPLKPMTIEEINDLINGIAESK